MKPLNLDNRPCSPISSNCVVWQGPTLDCIELCNGDTISDVVAKMAEELCTLLDQTNVDNYDLTCLGITACGPKDFQALIQLLIEKICELDNLPTDGTKTEGACPDCPVTVAACLRETDRNLPVTMQLVDYVQMLASKICSLIDAIGDLQDQINSLNIRVTILEEATPPSFTLPSLTVSCDLGASVNISPGTTVNPSVSRTIDIVLDALINDSTKGYCIYTATLGPVSQLLTAISRKCVLDSTDRLSGSGTYGSISGWVPDASYDTVADAINNIWLVLCDIFAYASNVNISVVDSSSIDLSLTSGVISARVLDTGWVDLLGFNFYTGSALPAKPQCRRIGNIVYFRGSAVIPLADAAAGGAPLPFDTVNGTANQYITSTLVGPSVTGAGSVYLASSSGAVYWNNQVPVIPLSVVSATASNSGTTMFDNAYSKQLTLGTRVVLIKNSSNPAQLVSTTVSTVGTLFITTDGKLAITTVRDSEESNVTAYQSYYSWNTSHLNSIVSHVVVDQFVPNYQAINTTLHSNSSSGVNPVKIDFTQSDTWTVVRNTPVNPFSFQYRFSFNGNDINSLGGVVYSLEGLVAYIDPCTEDIKPYVNCAPK